MAVMDLSTRMVFWNIYVEGLNITPLIGPYVESIRVRNTILPTPKNTKKMMDKEKNYPSNAEIVITSKNYIEDIFLEGLSIEIDMGYDRLNLTTVFKGTIFQLPEGNAKEMLNYTVKAVSGLADLSKEQKRKTFASPIKRNIVYEILSDPNYNYYPVVDIDDISPIKITNLPIQNKMTDYQFLTECAIKWNCVMWEESPNYVFFVDAKKAHDYQLGMIGKAVYTLGYRTDKTRYGLLPVKNNVEQISWKHKPAEAAVSGNPGVFGFNEDGEIKGLSEYEIIALDTDTGRWATWRLNTELINASLAGKILIGPLLDSIYLTIKFRGYNAVRRYFHIVKYNDNTNPESPPYDNTGMEITVTLNEGDPDLFPPRNAVLFSGALNPLADTSHLPKWMFRWGDNKHEMARLKINEVILTYSDGLMRSELLCTMALPSF